MAAGIDVVAVVDAALAVETAPKRHRAGAGRGLSSIAGGANDARSAIRWLRVFRVPAPAADEMARTNEDV